MKINPNNQLLQPAIGNTTINQGALSGLQSFASTSLQTMNKAIAEADQARANSERANIIANMEKDKLTYAKQEFEIQTKQLSLDYISKITEIDARLRQEEQRRDSAVFNTGAALSLNSQLNEIAQRIRTQVPSDGAGYSELFNKEALQAINNLSAQAPNDEAKLQFQLKAAEMLAQGTAAVLSDQRGMRIQNRKNIMAESVSQLQNSLQQNANEATLNEASVNLNNIFSNLDLADFTNAEKEAFKTQAIKGLQTSYITGLLGQNNPLSFEKASDFIQNDFVKNASPEEYNKIVGLYETSVKEFNKLMLEQSKLAVGRELLLTNSTSSTTESKKAGDEFFAQMGMGALQNGDVNTLTKTFLTVGSHAGELTKNTVKNSLYGRDPVIANTMAQALVNASDPVNGNINVLNSLDAEDLAFSKRLVSLTSFGFTQAEALQQLQLEKSLPKATVDVLDQKFKEQISDSDGATIVERRQNYVRKLGEEAIDKHAALWGISKSSITDEDIVAFSSLYQSIWTKNNGNKDLADEEFKIRVTKSYYPSEFSSNGYLKDAPEMYFREEGALDEIRDSIKPAFVEILKNYLPKEIINDKELGLLGFTTIASNPYGKEISYQTASGETNTIKLGLRPIYGITDKQSSDPVKGIVKSYHVYDELTNTPLLVNGVIPVITIDSNQLSVYNKYRMSNEALADQFRKKQEADAGVDKKVLDMYKNNLLPEDNTDFKTRWEKRRADSIKKWENFFGGSKSKEPKVVKPANPNEA